MGGGLYQASGLLREWRLKHAHSCGPCHGPTSGLEAPRTPSCGSTCGHRPHSTLHHAEACHRQNRTLVLFLGDSLVSGVGGQAGKHPLPAALPRAVAARLSDLGGTGAVQWASVGIVGAGVDRLSEEGVPKLRAKVGPLLSEARHVVIVLVVGVNDLKQMNFSGYRQGVRRLVAELRTLVGELRDAHRRGQAVDIFLPELKIADAPLLQRFPLKYLARPICAIWEREKRKALERVGDEVASAEILTSPQSPPEGVDVASLFSPDKMHPSLKGYEWWAEDLARQIHHRLAARSSVLVE